MYSCFLLMVKTSLFVSRVPDGHDVLKPDMQEESATLFSKLFRHFTSASTMTVVCHVRPPNLLQHMPVVFSQTLTTVPHSACRSTFPKSSLHRSGP